MTFIITLVALVAERFFHWGQLRHWRWFMKFQRWLSMTKVNQWPSALSLTICILPALLLVGLVNGILGSFLFGILKLIFGIFILMYCLGPKNFWVQAYSCMAELNNDDTQSALEKIDAAFQIGTPENSQAFHRALVNAFFLASYQRVFGVVFWFVVLGPVGAVLYRLLTLLCVDSPLGLNQKALKWLSILDWVPVRLFTFMFALAGHFTCVFQCWKSLVFTGIKMNDTLLLNCGIAALALTENKLIPETGEAEKEALGLLDRVYVIALVILAVCVLLV